MTKTNLQLARLCETICAGLDQTAESGVTPLHTRRALAQRARAHTAMCAATSAFTFYPADDYSHPWQYLATASTALVWAMRDELADEGGNNHAVAALIDALVWTMQAMADSERL